MESIRDDTIGGFNTFLEEQKDFPGTATLTLVQFDSQDPYELIHRFIDIQQIPALTRQTYIPRASTPLLDAMGRGINDLEECLSDLDEAERPSKVIMVIITDGQENSSREFQKDQIVKMISEKKVKGDWQFVFLSADLDAIGDAVSIGIDMDSTLHFKKSAKGSTDAWKSLSARTSNFRIEGNKKMGFIQDDQQSSNDPKDG